MKSIKLLLISFFICTLAFVPADENLAEENKPYILVNSNTTYPSGHSITGGYKHFADYCRAAGFIIDQHSFHGFAAQDLEGVDVLVLPSPRFALLDEDKNALRAFMKKGGGLLVMAYPGESDASNLDSLIRDYGIWFEETSRDVYGLVLSASPLAGPEQCAEIGDPFVDTATFYLGFNPKHTGIAVRTKYGKVIAAVSKHKFLGKGRLVVMGTDIYLFNGLIDFYDNKAFSMNLMNYLAGYYDLSVALCKFKGSSATAGERSTLIVKVKNLGDKSSEATSISFHLTNDGILTAPPETIATLKTIKLKPIEAGKSKKIRTRVKIPDSVAAGDYYLVAVVDPEGTSKDSDQSNNTKASKKSIEVR